MADRNHDTTAGGGPTGSRGPRGSRAWLWVALGAAAVLVWVVIALTRDEGGEPALPGDTLHPVVADTLGVPEPGRRPATAAAAEDVMGRVEEMRAAVRRYEDQCMVRLEPEAGRGTGAIVAECIRRLGDAMDAIVAGDTVGGVVLEERLSRWRDRISQLRSAPPGDERAEPTREVLTSAADVLEAIRDARYEASLEVGEALEDLEEGARAIDPDTPLSAQQDRVRRYFQLAGAVVGAMARPGDPGPGAVD